MATTVANRERKPRGRAAVAGKRSNGRAPDNLKGVRMSALLVAVERAYAGIVKRHPELGKAEAPVFVIQSNPRMDTLGHFAAGRWIVQTGKDRKTDKPGHEIALVAEHLIRPSPDPAGDVFETILHESVHAANFLGGKQDTDQSGRYHNRRFRDKAEEYGLAVSQHPTYGYAITALLPETKALYRNEIKMLERALKMHRQGTGKHKVPTADRNYLKCRCECGRVIRMSRHEAEQGNVFCAFCASDFVPVMGGM